MSRTYAGILGLIAFTTTVLRGLLAGSELEATMLDAMLAMICFAVVGSIVGKIADRTILESIRAQLVKQPTSNEADPDAPSPG